MRAPVPLLNTVLRQNQNEMLTITKEGGGKTRVVRTSFRRRNGLPNAEGGTQSTGLGNCVSFSPVLDIDADVKQGVTTVQEKSVGHVKLSKT